MSATGLSEMAFLSKKPFEIGLMVFEMLTGRQVSSTGFRGG
jgi:hypothetical protein